MLKWKLMLTTLPYVAAVLAFKTLLREVLHFPGWVEFTDLALVLTGSVFLMGFMLSGVMSDYKESEKLPGELACVLETIDDHFAQAAATKPGIDARPLHLALLALAKKVEDFLFKRTNEEGLFQALHDFTEPIQQLEVHGAGPVASRTLGELHNLRKALTRIHVISKTSFIQSGYALLDTLVTVTLVLLLISRFKTLLGEIIVSAVLTLIYVYMVRLIRDIDDPFDYEPDGSRGAAEVELFPLQDYRARLEKRLGV